MRTPLPSPIADTLTEDETGFQESTLRGYRSAWRDLLDWMNTSYPNERQHLVEELELGDLGALPPPELIAEYLEHRRELAWSTLTTRRQGLQLVYRNLIGENPFDYSAVDSVWSEIREEKREEPDRMSKRRLADREHGPADVIERGPELLRSHLDPAVSESDWKDLEYLPEKTARPEDLRPEAAGLIPDPTFELPVLRDRAILLLVATTDVPRKALVGIDIEDVFPPREEGGPTRIVMYGSSGDPTHVLRLESSPKVHLCPNRAVAAWILAGDLTSGPLFRPFTPHGGIREGRIRAQTLNRVIKRRAEEAGLDPKEWSTRKFRS